MDILPQLLINALITGSIYALASSGLSLVYGLLRILNFAHGHMLMCGAYAFYYSSVELELSILASSAFTLLVIIALSYCSMKVFVSPFLKYSVLLALVTTLALSIVFESIVSIIFGVNVKSLNFEAISQSIEIDSIYTTQIFFTSLFILSFALFTFIINRVAKKIISLKYSKYLAGIISIFIICFSWLIFINHYSIVSYFDLTEVAETLEIGSVFITKIQIIIIASAIVILSFIAFIIHSTVPGRFIRALSENSYAGQSLGINHNTIYYGVFIVGAIMAAFAGVMVAYETNLQPLMGNSYTIKSFAAMILGGLGNFWGTIAGSYILGLTENLSIGLDWGGYSLPAGYKDAFAFVIILLILIVKPNGLFSKRTRKA